MADWATFFDPEHVFSILAFMGFIGFGLWFARDFFPWLKSYLETKQTLAHEADVKRIEADSESDRRWQDTVGQMTGTFADLKESLGQFSARQEQFLSNLELLMHYILNGKPVEDKSTGRRIKGA